MADEPTLADADTTTSALAGSPDRALFGSTTTSVDPRTSTAQTPTAAESNPSTPRETVPTIEESFTDPIEVPGNLPPEVEVPNSSSLSDSDRAAFQLCGAVARLQLAGVEFVQASATPTATMGPFLDRIVASIRGLSAIAPPSTNTILEAVLGRLLAAQPSISGTPDLESIRDVVGAVAPDMAAALGQLVFLCPGQIDQSTTDQVDELLLGPLA